MWFTTQMWDSSSSLLMLRLPDRGRPRARHPHVWSASCLNVQTCILFLRDRVGLLSFTLTLHPTQMCRATQKGLPAPVILHAKQKAFPLLATSESIHTSLSTCSALELILLILEASQHLEEKWIILYSSTSCGLRSLWNMNYCAEQIAQVVVISFVSVLEFSTFRAVVFCPKMSSSTYIALQWYWSWPHIEITAKKSLNIKIIKPQTTHHIPFFIILPLRHSLSDILSLFMVFNHLSTHRPQSDPYFTALHVPSKPLLNDQASYYNLNPKSQSGSLHHDHNVMPTIPTNDTSGSEHKPS